MNKDNKLAKGLAIFFCCLVCPLSQAGNFDNEWFRIFGRWDGNELRADSIQLRLPDKEPNRGQLSGQVEDIDLQSHRLTIGPFLIRWSDETLFNEIAVGQITVGMTLKISGNTSKDDEFVARKIEKESTPFASHSLQITGLSSTSFERKDGVHEFKVLNIPVYTAQNGYNILKSLIRRQDVRRPDDQLKVDLFGKPVTLGGAYDFNPRLRNNFDLDDSEQDANVRIDNELKLEAFYPISDFTAVFLSFVGSTTSRFNYSEESKNRTTFEIDRDETWIFFDRLFGTGFGLQFGNQNVSETREWWWDKDMDSLRLYYNQGPFHFELNGGKQIGGESTLISLSPSDKEVTRLMGMASYAWSYKQRLELFFLKQWDQSSQEQVGNVIKRINRDSFDDNMTWYGGRAIGQIGLDDYGDLNYWADFAGVHGEETVISYDSIDSIYTQVESKLKNDVTGWAFDIGAFWTLPFEFQPTLTLSYAHGSGDPNPNDKDGRNNTFRQTGIQRNNWRFNGVNRFKIYGELFDPELSNLNIFTTALGVRVLKNSSIELVYHKYDQVEAVDKIRNNNINQSPNGSNRDIGHEIDLVTNFREWKRLELELTGSMFNPGSAFDNRDIAYSVYFDVNYNF
jgi:alginate production protein